MCGAQDNKLLHIEGKFAYYTGRDVIVKKAIWGGEKAKLFTEIQNVRRESIESNEKYNKKKRFPFVERRRCGHDNSLLQF